MALPLSIWTTGRPVPGAEERRGSFFDMIVRALGEAWQGELHDIDCSLEELPQPDRVAGVIITGSPARIASRDPWMLRVEGALRTYRASNVPVLGICFGHQLMGMALGGHAGPNPNGREIGTYPLEHLLEDSIVRPEPGDAGFFPEEVSKTGPPQKPGYVVMTHLDSVTELPPGAERLAATRLEPHAAVRFSRTMWGVQFHPEMDADIIGEYLEARRTDIAAEGLDVTQLLAERVDSPYGADLLRRFARFCADSGPK